MTSKKENKRGYGIIEPPIYEKLDWNMESIISCLEFIRIQLPKVFVDFPKSIQYEIIPLGNPFGEPYPVIGFYSDIPEDLKHMPDFIDLYDDIEKWLEQVGIETIKKEAENINIESWETIKNRNL